MDLKYQEIEEKKEWVHKREQTIKDSENFIEKMKEFLKISDISIKEGFLYPHLNLGIKPDPNSIKTIPRHDKKPCIWVDTELKLKEMADDILNTSKAIGVDTEYHDFEKVIYKSL